MLPVTAAIIRADFPLEDGTTEERILIAQRKSPEWLRGLWEFPGGKIEEGESPADCLQRELREELGIECRIGRRVMIIQHCYPQLDVQLEVFEASIVSGEAVAHDHSALAWVRAQELGSYEMAPADMPAVRALLSE